MKKLLFLFLLLSFLGLLFFSLFEINRVSGDAMEPAIKSKQTVIFRKFGIHNPKRGDIVLYQPKYQETSKTSGTYSMDYIGRVVGLPTESVRVENSNLYLDNNVEKLRVEEEYLSPSTKTIAREEGEWFKIGEFEYFILTDKREKDFSIPWRFIHRNNIKGILFIKL